MQIRELVELGAFLKEFIQTQALPNQYTELINAINQAAQNQNVGQVDAFYKKLLQTHQEAEKQILSPAQSKLLSDYGAENILGHTAITATMKDRHS